MNNIPDDYSGILLLVYSSRHGIFDGIKEI